MPLIAKLDSMSLLGVAKQVVVLSFVLTCVIPLEDVSKWTLYRSWTLTGNES